MKRIALSDSADGERIVDEAVSASAETLCFDPAYAARMISDIVPNPQACIEEWRAWQARQI